MERANLALRLVAIARQIERLAEELRKPGHDPELSKDLWDLCAAHQRLIRRIEGDVSILARGTLEMAPLPEKKNHSWGLPSPAVEAYRSFLDSDSEPSHGNPIGFDDPTVVHKLPGKQR